MVKTSRFLKNTAAATTLLGVGIVLGRLITPEPDVVIVNEPSSDIIDPLDNSIIVNIDDDNIIDNIRLAWMEKRILTVSIPDSLIMHGDSFETNPKNSNTCDEFINKIEEQIVVSVKIFGTKRDAFIIRNGEKLLKLTHKTQSEGNTMKNLFTDLSKTNPLKCIK